MAAVSRVVGEMGVSVPLLRCVAALKKWVRVGWVVVRVWWCVAVAVGAFLVVMWLNPLRFSRPPTHYL